MAATEVNTEASYLVVPINVEAMCVGDEDEKDNHFTTDPYQFNLLNHKEVIPLSKYIHKATKSKMEKGVYIHWALPDGLTHSIENEGNFEFPIVPNRWLVSRLIDDNELQHWVVESDYLNDINKDGYQSQPIPYKLEKRETAVKYLGRVLSIEEWQKNKNKNVDNAYQKLNTMGYGIPEFAASYQHSKGVFSFYDADIKNIIGDVSVSYFVVGWYECYESKHPILGEETQKIAELLEHYRWCLPQDTIIENLKINEMYCSGSISGINWNVKKKYLNDLQYPEMSLAIGHNESEALSAIISGLSGDDQQSEQLLNALQLGLLKDIIEPNSINNLHNINIKLNDATFQSKESGTYWQIEPETKSNSENSHNWKLDSLLNDTQLSIKLNDLNKLQKQKDDLQQKLIARKNQLYLYWTASLMPNTNYQTDLRTYLKEQVDILTKKEKELKNESEDSNNRINKLKRKIEEDLAKSTGSNYSFVLKEYPNARYYKSLEPVILFQGAKINAPQRYGGDGAYAPNNTLVCRLNNQLINEVNEIKLNENILPPNFNVVPKEIIADLLFTNPNYLYNKDKSFSIDAYKEKIKKFILPQSEPLKGTKATTLKEGLNHIQNSKEDYYTTVSQANRVVDEVVFNNISPSPVGINFWENTNPWLPLYFSYDVSYYPVLSKKENIFDSNFIINNFNLDHESDKLQIKNYYSFSQKGIHYQNTCLLSQHSKINLQTKIEEFISKHPEQIELDEILTQFLEQSQHLPDMLSQCLFGLNDALVGLKNSLQLPVVNYDENVMLEDLAKSIDTVINTYNNFELDNSDGSTHYFPLSGGLLKINSLTIVDVFGRHVDVTRYKQFSASSLKVSDETIPNLYLAPRIVSPSKLKAIWVDKNNNPTNGLLVSNPILGWLMPNFIDKSIWLFTSDGQTAGELTNEGTWEKTPGTTFESCEQVKENNIEFGNILSFLEKEENLVNFLDKVKNNLETNQPENHRTLNANALFFGVPLAIAKVNLSIEIEGLPPIDYNKTSIEAELEEENLDVFIIENKFKRCNGLDKVNLPLLVGNNNHVGDGLMAYCNTKDYNTFYYDNEGQTLKLNGSPLELSVVFDPRNNIHFHTGILPVKELRLDSFYYSHIVQNLQLAIQVKSVLVAKGYNNENDHQIKMPLPDAGSATWNWIDDSGQIVAEAMNEFDDAINENFNELTKGWLKLTNTK